MSDWDATKAREALEMERSVMGIDPSDQEACNRAAMDIFRGAVLEAALAITHLAVSAESDRIRLDAAKYVVERNLGRIGDDNGGASDPLEDFVRAIHKEVLSRE